MWYNNVTKEKIRQPKGFTYAGVQYPADVFKRWSEAELIAVNIFPVVEGQKPDPRYYTYTVSEGVVGNEYQINYTPVERPLADIQARMIKDLEAHADRKEEAPEIDSGLGYKIKGSRKDLDSFERGKKKGLLEIRDANGNKQAVTSVEFDAIIAAIEDTGLALFNTKWTKFDEIKALTTVAQCVNYEHEPYNYTITAEDVANDITGTLVAGTTETRYRNNITSW